MPEAVLGTYAPSESEEALALDAACVQPGALRLSFRRPVFHARASSYPEHVILTARLEQRLVGTLAVGVKPAEFLRRPARAAFAFDLRVHPQARGRGIAGALAREALAWAERHADLAYAYTVDENRPAARVGELLGFAEAGGYAYLVCPSASPPPAHHAVREIGYDEAHAALVASAGPFDLYADPGFRPGEGGWVASWLLVAEGGMAGCSAYSHRATLAEVVEGIPAPLRAARALGDAGLPWPSRWPRVPRDGEELRSWYVFDAFATRPELGAELVRHVAREARTREIDWCYLVHTARDTWVAAVRADLPSLFAPVLRYRLLLRRFDGVPVPPLERLHVDVRDL